MLALRYNNQYLKVTSSSLVNPDLIIFIIVPRGYAHFKLDRRDISNYLFFLLSVISLLVLHREGGGTLKKQFAGLSVYRHGVTLSYTWTTLYCESPIHKSVVNIPPIYTTILLGVEPGTAVRAHPGSWKKISDPQDQVIFNQPRKKSSRFLISQEGRLKSHPSFTSLLQNNLLRETVFSLLQ
jgi:hypothetical protein